VTTTEHALARHALGTSFGSRCEIFAGIDLAPGPSVRLRYRLRGDLAQLEIAARAAPRRVDGLWERTCFEAFVAPEGRDRYAEINVAPSTEWAAYEFDRYRHGMRPLALAREPVVEVARKADELRVTADVDLSTLSDAPWPWRVGLCAVIVETDGARSYWALKHPGTKPDFHDAAGYTLRLEGTTR
jgi:hypothetical protein